MSKKQEFDLCNLSGCSEKYDLMQCYYCKKYYCPDHIAPIRPAQEKDKNLSFLESKQKISGHMCAEWANSKDKEDKEKDEYYSEKLKTFLKDTNPKTLKEIETAQKKKDNKSPSNFKKWLDNTYDNNKFTLLSLAIILFIFLAFVIISYQKPVYENKSVTELINRSMIVDSPKPLSLGNVTDITDRYYSKEIMVIGYIEENHTKGSDNSTIVKKYVVDDYNKKIRISLGYTASKNYDYLFAKAGISNNTYKVSGLLSNKYSELILDVYTIENYTRDYYTHEINYSEVVAVEKNIMIGGGLNFSYGLSKLLGKTK